MKPGKALLIILSIVVVLLILAWIINMSNKKKAAAAAGSQVPANPAILGRYVANAASLTSDYTAIDSNGKAIWLWAGSRGNCSSGYTKVLDGPDTGWCVLNQIASRQKPTWKLSAGKGWCPINNNIPIEGWKVCTAKID